MICVNNGNTSKLQVFFSLRKHLKLLPDNFYHMTVCSDIICTPTDLFEICQYELISIHYVAAAL